MKCQGDGCVRPSGDGGVCDECWNRRHVLLRDIPDLWCRLHGELEKSAPGLSEAVSRPHPGSKPPLAVPVLDLLALVPRRLVGWANLCQSSNHYRQLTFDGTSWGRQLMTAVRVLRADDEELRDSPAAYRYIQTLAELHRRMTRQVGGVETVRRMDAPCIACGQRRRALFVDVAEGTVTCKMCGHVEEHNSWASRILTAADM